MQLKRVFASVRKELKAKDQAREAVLGLSRRAVRLSAQAILLMHRGALRGAEARLGSARKVLEKLEGALGSCPELRHASSVYTAYQEYAEANIFFGFIKGGTFPSPSAIGVSSIPYVLGLADAVGELRRRALDSIRKGKVAEAERCLKAMEEVYEAVITIDQGYALIPDFRRKCDLIRRRIEESRGDISVVKAR